MINIKNKKAGFEYEFLDKFEAGIKLTGTEIKSIRNSNANISEAFCFLKDGELFIKNMYIAVYEIAGVTNHNELRDRKLLLHRHQLKKISENMKNQSLTIIPINLFINKNGIAKINIAIARGKKLWDKRNTIKERETKRSIDRINKI